MKTLICYEFPTGHKQEGALFGTSYNIKEPKKLFKRLTRMGLNYDQAMDYVVTTSDIAKRNRKYYRRDPHRLPNDVKLILSYNPNEERWELQEFDVPAMLKAERLGLSSNSDEIVES